MRERREGDEIERERKTVGERHREREHECERGDSLVLGGYLSGFRLFFFSSPNLYSSLFLLLFEVLGL